MVNEPDQSPEEWAKPSTWINVVRRVRFTGVVPGVSGAAMHNVASALASYAEYADGTRVHPGTARVAVDGELGYKLAKACINALRDLGLIRMTRTGRKIVDANHYRLALPADLMDRLTVLSPAQVDLAAEAIREEARRAYTPRASRRGRDVRVPEVTVQTAGETGVRGPEAPVQEPDAEMCTVTSGPRTEMCTVTSGPRTEMCTVTSEPPYLLRRPPTTPTPPTQVVDPEPVTVRAREADEDQIFPGLVVEVAAALTLVPAVPGRHRKTTQDPPRAGLWPSAVPDLPAEPAKAPALTGAALARAALAEAAARAVRTA